MPVTSALIVEPRNYTTLDYVIKNVRQALPDIPIYLHHGSENEDLAKAIQSTVEDMHLVNMQRENLTILDYSKYMTTQSLYDSLPSGHTVVFQTDSAFCDPTHAETKPRLEEYTKYSYVGAPWAKKTGYSTKCDLHEDIVDSECTFGIGGNGGFSLRDTEMMSKLTNMGRPEHPEDTKLTNRCIRTEGCMLPPLLHSGEFVNQHMDFTAETTDSNTFRGVVGRECLKTERLPLAFHKPNQPCTKSFYCPARENMPPLRTMTPEETKIKIEEILKN